MFSKNKEILSWANEFFREKNIQTRLREKAKKFFKLEFYFTGKDSKIIPAKNIVKIYPSKGKVFWKILFKVEPDKRFDLSHYSNCNYSIYPIEWNNLKNSILLIGGLRRCIYTCLYIDIFKRFMEDTLKYFLSQAELAYSKRPLLRHI